MSFNIDEWEPKTKMGKLVKEGADAAVTNQVRKQVTNQALKKLGGKVGMGAAVMPMETGGMYGELFESQDQHSLQIWRAVCDNDRAPLRFLLLA